MQGCQALDYCKDDTDTLEGSEQDLDVLQMI